MLGGIQSVWFCRDCSVEFRQSKNKPKENDSEQTRAIEEIKLSILNEIKETIPQMLQNEIGNHLKTNFHSQIEEVKALRGEIKADNINLNEKLDSCLTFAQVTSKGLPKNEQVMTSFSQDFQELKAQNDHVMTTISKDLQQFKTSFESKQAQEKETQERELRLNNICFFNVPESKSNDPVTEAKEDSEILQIILKNKVELKRADIKTMFRAGQKQDNKTRPIIMKLTTNQKKMDIIKLRNLEYEIKDTSGTEAVISIYVSPDRTKKQQEENRKLVQELKQKREEDKENKYIIDHKLQKVVPFRPKSQFYWD